VRALETAHHHLLQHLSPAAKPIIDALGTRLPGCDVGIRALTLIIQHGPERVWDWSIVGTIRLVAPART
jgi:hypothetical protein